MKSSVQEFYQTNAAKHKTTAEQLQKRINTISVLRFVAALLLFFCAYSCIYGMWNVSSTAWLLSFFTMFAVFAALVTHHARLFKQKEKSDALREVNIREEQALAGDWSSFPHGAEYFTHPALPQANDFALDLDIFGEASLFQRMNRTCTPHGSLRLAEMLTSTLETKSSIEERQTIIAELKERSGFRQEWYAARSSRVLSQNGREGLEKWLYEEPVLKGKIFLKVLMFALPVLFLCSLVFLIFHGEHPFAMKLITVCFIANMLTAAVFLRVIMREATLGERFAPLLGVYVRLLKVVLAANESSPFHTSSPKRVVACAEEATREIQRLSWLLNRFQEGNSLAGAIFLNGTVLWNLHCAAKLEQWRERNKTRTAEWFEAIAEMDALVSLSGFAFNHPHCTNPILQEASSVAQNEAIVRVSGLGHPFLTNESCVRNDLSFDREHGRVCVITGANMAGKSTFLRALGLNTVLAMIGLPVNATHFECSPVQVLTSMRTTDSLERHESYFFAELQRLRMITERVHSPEAAQTLVLLDEVLRGTNSADKKSGTIGLLRRFIAANTPTVIATHDTDVGALEQEFPETVRNYSFEGRIENDELSFDYRLHRGIAANKNATFLLQKMGIIPKE
ncbi:MAG: hypothetical protein EAZ92_13110 [Candidatus Kapaibacterium sp.]|nr:MAG: hypothetical protein EAZ92_13110 [Candidatus Kapabacteria bacterium]